MGYDEQVRRDLVRAQEWEELGWLARLSWMLNHPDDEFGFYYHAIHDVAVKYGHLDLGTTRKRLTLEDIFHPNSVKRRQERQRTGAR